MTESPTYFLLPNLDVNEIKTFDLDVTAVKKGIFENIFNAQFESSSDKDKYTTKTKTKVVKSEIKIETLTPVNAFVFKEADVKINIRNTGDTDLKNLNITQVLPDSFSIIDSSNGRIKDNAIGWLIPLLPAGNSQLITTKVSANLPELQQLIPIYQIKKDFMIQPNQQQNGYLFLELLYLCPIIRIP